MQQFKVDTVTHAEIREKITEKMSGEKTILLTLSNGDGGRDTAIELVFKVDTLRKFQALIELVLGKAGVKKFSEEMDSITLDLDQEDAS